MKTGLPLVAALIVGIAEAADAALAGTTVTSGPFVVDLSNISMPAAMIIVTFLLTRALSNFTPTIRIVVASEDNGAFRIDLRDEVKED